MKSSKKRDREISLSDFRRKTQKLIDQMRKRGDEIIITSRGEPVAKVIALRRGSGPLHGSMRDTIEIVGDIVNCDWSEEWEAAQ